MQLPFFFSALELRRDKENKLTHEVIGKQEKGITLLLPFKGLEVLIALLIKKKWVYSITGRL